MAVLLQVAQLGQTVLRKKAKPVENVGDPKIQNLIEDMVATVMEVDGVGIAAPQVYQSLRIFIIASHPNSRYPNAPIMKPTAIINPRILSHSKTLEKDWEGCLSIPGVRALVPRYKKIRVQFTDKKGKKVVRNFADFLARIFQHELDHLDGLMFLDRLDSNQDIITEKEYQKLVTKK